MVDDHNNVILSLMTRSMGDGAASTLTLAIGPATRNRAGVLTAEESSFFSITQSNNHNNYYTTSTTFIIVVAVVQML